jgi:hypothetical protein
VGLDLSGETTRSYLKASFIFYVLKFIVVVSIEIIVGCELGHRFRPNTQSGCWLLLIRRELEQLVSTATLVYGTVAKMLSTCTEILLGTKQEKLRVFDGSTGTGKYKPIENPRVWCC